MDEKFDVIVVGAGLAGLSAAIKLAREGLEVVLIERGPYPGSKNLSGGVLYGRVLEKLIPEYWNEAPVERYIINNRISFLTDSASINVDFKSQTLAQEPYNAFAVLRAPFDRWLGDKAEEAGVMLVTNICVDGLVRNGNTVTGVVAGGDEMLADVVIAADGATSFLAEEAGLRGRWNNHHLAVCAKELIELPRETIEERFNISGNEGVAYAVVGSVTKGVPGGGFLYTNKESVSIGVVSHLDETIRTGIRPYDMLDGFLSNPLIEPLIRGGRLGEYGAHLIVEGGLAMVPQLSMGGMLVVGDAAGLGVNTGLTVRGMDLAIESGMIAADTVLAAKARGDFSAKSLATYRRRLEESFALKDMHTYAGAPRFMKGPRMYKAYPELLADILDSVYMHEAQPKEHLSKVAIRSLKANPIKLWDLMKDGIKGVRSL
jgi:electron transfer flavoprotein-quinone oxidoreductase